MGKVICNFDKFFLRILMVVIWNSNRNSRLLKDFWKKQMIVEFFNHPRLLPTSNWLLRGQLSDLLDFNANSQVFWKNKTKICGDCLIHLLATPLLKSKTFQFLPKVHFLSVWGEHDTVLLGSQVIFEVIWVLVSSTQSVQGIISPAVQSICGTINGAW